jgi:hypothetical protein
MKLHDSTEDNEIQAQLNQKDWNKIRANDSWGIFKIMSEFVNGYEPSMESDLNMMIEALPASEYNKYMDGIVNDDNKIIGDFIAFCEEAVKEL